MSSNRFTHRLNAYLFANSELFMIGVFLPGERGDPGLPGTDGIPGSVGPAGEKGQKGELNHLNFDV